MNAEQSNPILNSKLAYNILELLAKEEKGDYGKRIAEKLDKPQSSVCRVLTSLTEENFVNRGKRTRAQYYKINYTGLSDFWYETLLKELERDSKEHELMAEKSEKVKKIGERFFRRVLTENNGNSLTVSELLYNCILYSIGGKILNEEGFLDRNPIMIPITEGTVRKLDMRGYPEELEEIADEVS